MVQINSEETDNMDGTGSESRQTDVRSHLNSKEKLTSVKGTSLTRVERKRQQARERIIKAAETLMRNRPVDEITIQDITDAADIGHGSFYLHFKSKYEVLVPIIEKHAEQIDQRIQVHIQQLTDSAEVMALSGRLMARSIISDPLWQWFLKHSGVPVEDMRRAIGRFSDRDFRVGLKSGRFNVPDTEVSTSFVFGGFVNAMIATIDSDNIEQAIDNNMELILRVFGIPIDEANEIAHKPLPSLENSK